MRTIPTTPPDTLPLATSVAEIDLSALQHNTRVLQSVAQHASLMAVVKADAYGHGAIRITRTLQLLGIHDFSVATVPEGIELRNAGIEDRILVFGAPLHDYLPAYVEHDLDLTVSSKSVAEAAIETAKTVGPLRVHIKVDTGMGRIGLHPTELLEVYRRLEQAAEITIIGIWTHFATADEEDNSFAVEQLSRFKTILDLIDDRSLCIHVANSAALLRQPESFAFQHALVRTGIALYGVQEIPDVNSDLELRSVMRFRSRITHTKTVDPGTTISYGRKWKADKPTRIATVATGYADGYPRILSNRAEVGVRGYRFPIAGTVCMDMFMIDLGNPDGPGALVEVGDEVTLFGTGGPSAVEVARWADTIPYEIVCAVSARVPRVYI